MNESESPSPDILNTLDWEGLKYVTVKAALELDIFNIIAEGNSTLEEIANRAKASLRGMEILLNALCPLGFLTKTNDNYGLSPLSSTYLIRGKPSYSADIYLTWWKSRERLLDCIRKGITELNFGDEDKQDLWAMYASQELITWPQTAKRAQQTWESIGINKDTTPALQILDVGSGTGSKSFVLAQADPSVKVTVSDFPKVLEVSSQIAEKMGVSQQVSYLPGDITKTEFPIERFGLVNFGSILYYFNANQVKGLLRKAHQALREDGILVIQTLIADEERCESLAPLLGAVELLHDAKFSHVYSFSEYKDLIEAVDFTNVTKPVENIIRANK